MKDSRGFSMIEVLIAMLIIAIGVLGAVALQNRAIQAGVEAYQRTQALMLVEDMVTRMRNNKANVSTCYAAVAQSPGFIGAGRPMPDWNCEDRADKDLTEWNAMLLGASELSDNSASATNVGGIIDARGCIRPVPLEAGVYRVSVAWRGLNQIGFLTDRDDCAAGLYDIENFRRVVGVTVRITDLR